MGFRKVLLSRVQPALLRRVGGFALAMLLLTVFACRSRDALPHAEATAPVTTPPSFVVAGWLPYWDWPNGRASLTRNLNVLDEVSPFWYEMQADGSLKLNTSAQVIADVLSIVQNGGKPVIPTISNGASKDRVRAAITEPVTRTAHVNTIVAEVMSRGYAGIDIDYESLYPEDRDLFSAFMAELAGALHARGRRLTVAVHPKTSDPTPLINPRAHDYLALGAVVDELRIMTYDWSWKGGAPGPIAPYWWVEDVVEFAKTQVDPTKIMVGIPFYGYDWPPAAATPAPPGIESPPDDLPPPPLVSGAAPAAPLAATAVEWLKVRDLLARYQPGVEWSEAVARGPVREPWFSYADGTATHTVWFADHDSVAARRELAQRLGVRGVAVWRLGSEDPANWAALDARPCRADLDRDGAYDITDVMLAARAWDSVAGEGTYDPRADLLVDGQVDVTDVQQAAAGWLTGCP